MDTNIGAFFRMEQYLRKHCFLYKFLAHDNGNVLALYSENGDRVFSVVPIPTTNDPSVPQDVKEKKKTLLLINHRKNFNDVPMTYEQCANALHYALDSGIIARKLN